jgi:hypothetical protein
MNAAWAKLVFSVLCAGLWPTQARAQDSSCSRSWIAPGQRTVTPAEVTGAPTQHLTLRGHHPENDDPYARSSPDDGYLLTGDKVDLVTTCDGYAYVRFHGKGRVSTGWVEASRIQATGSPYLPLPPNAAALCHAAEATLNRDGRLQPMGSIPAPSLLRALHMDEDLNASPSRVSHFDVDGRPLAATSIDSGGTCHSSSVFVLSGDLKTRLSPPDRDSRDIENQGNDAWGFGISEELVTVLGQPMVLSYRNPSSFHLSAIDRNGDIVPTCTGGMATLDQRELLSSTDDHVCHAMLADRQTPVAMQPPGPGEVLSMAQLPAGFRSQPPGYDRGDSPTTKDFRDDYYAAVASYTLQATGNIGTGGRSEPRRMGIVSFTEGDSTAGCGTFSRARILPVYLDAQGRADPSSVLNRKLADALPEGMSEGKLATYEGSTYLELSRKKGEAPSEVWKLDAQGPRKVCSFKLFHMVVRPISE